MKWVAKAWEKGVKPGKIFENQPFQKWVFWGFGGSKESVFSVDFESQNTSKIAAAVQEIQTFCCCELAVADDWGLPK